MKCLQFRSFSRIFFTVFAILFAAENSEAALVNNSQLDLPFTFDWLPASDNPAEADDLNEEVAPTKESSHALALRPVRIFKAFDLSLINQDVIKGFGEAWRQSGSGTSHVEGFLLILRDKDGGYVPKVMGRTNEYQRFTFAWQPDIVAIVHTHPNHIDPRPAYEDMRVADRCGVPIITITVRGMFIYDPHTKKTSKIKDGLGWLDRKNWNPGAS